MGASLYRHISEFDRAEETARESSGWSAIGRGMSAGFYTAIGLAAVGAPLLAWKFGTELALKVSGGALAATALAASLIFLIVGSLRQKRVQGQHPLRVFDVTSRQQINAALIVLAEADREIDGARGQLQKTVTGWGESGKAGYVCLQTDGAFTTISVVLASALAGVREADSKSLAEAKVAAEDLATLLIGSIAGGRLDPGMDEKLATLRGRLRTLQFLSKRRVPQASPDQVLTIRLPKSIGVAGEEFAAIAKSLDAETLRRRIDQLAPRITSLLAFIQRAERLETLAPVDANETPETDAARARVFADLLPAVQASMARQKETLRKQLVAGFRGEDASLDPLPDAFTAVEAEVRRQLDERFTALEEGFSMLIAELRALPLKSQT